MEASRRGVSDMMVSPKPRSEGFEEISDRTINDPDWQIARSMTDFAGGGDAI